MPTFNDLTGQRFGRLVVIERAPNEANRQTRWSCLCDCGATTVQRAAALRGAVVKSCGCLRTELATARLVAATRKADAEIGYTAAHDRVKRARGKAGGYSCVDCAGPATDWSLVRDPSAARVQEAGREKGMQFSTDVNDYEPRCRSCHGRHDGWGRDADGMSEMRRIRWSA